MKMRFWMALALLLPFGALLGMGGQSVPMGALPVALSGGSFTPPAGSYWWKTLEGSGLSLTDSVSSNTATAGSGVTWTGVVGPLANALTFTGTSTYFYSTNGGDYNGTQAFSTVTWVTATTNPTDEVIVSNLDAGTVGWEVRRITGGGIRLQIIRLWSSSYLDVSGTCGLPSDGTLHQIATTYDGSEGGAGVHIYMDGVSCSTTTNNSSLSGTFSSGLGHVIYGTRNGGTYPWIGKIGNALITPSVLSATDVSYLYSNPYAQTAALDNFPGTSLSANWTVTQNSFTVGSGYAAGTSGAAAYAIWNANTFTANQFSQIKLVGGTYSLEEVALRMTQVAGARGGFTGYICVTGSSAGGSIYLDTFDPGGGFTNFAVGPGTSTAGDIVRIEAIGSTISCKVNGVVKAWVVNTTYATGQPGIGSENGASFSNWVGGNL